MISSGRDPEAVMEATWDLINEGTACPLFEASFEYEDVLIRADVLILKPEVRLVEVKSATSLKRHHLEDCAVQVWVIEGLGLPLRTIEVALVDTSFIYPGGNQYYGLLKYEEISHAVREVEPHIAGWVREFHEILAGDLPAISTGSHCFKPHECPFYAYCSLDDPDYPVKWLPGRTIKERLREANIDEMTHVPEEWLTSPRDKRVWRATINGKPELVPQAGEILRALAFPRFYLDFETIQPAIPQWAGTKPYQRIPFQWSCHIEHAPGEISQREFLEDSGDLPMRAFAESLLAAIGTSGPILVYSSYERTVLADLIKMFPDYADSLQAISDRLVDLLAICRNHYYHPDMKGSWSIKAVLPTVAPDLDYQSLGDVADGESAQRAYAEMIDQATPESRRAELKEGLLAYCRMDTIAMVRLAHFLEGRG